MEEHEDNNLTNKVAEKLKYRETLFDLVLLTNRSVDLADFKKHIDLMECMLSPYIDADYNKDLKDAIDSFVQEIKKWGSQSMPESALYGYEWTNLKAKYSALMKLAFRKNMLPQYELKPKVI